MKCAENNTISTKRIEVQSRRKLLDKLAMKLNKFTFALLKINKYNHFQTETDGILPLVNKDNQIIQTWIQEKDKNFN